MLAQFDLHTENSVPEQAFLSPSSSTLGKYCIHLPAPYPRPSAHNWCRGSMDHWDPTFINPLAAARPIILLDNAGVGQSGGEVPLTITDWAQNVIDVLNAIEVKQTDLLGFSMGGFAAQLIALNSPQLIRRLILAGTSASIGEGVVPPKQDPAVLRLKDAETHEDLRQAYITAFFTGSENCLKAGDEAWDRIVSARNNRSKFLGPEGTSRQFAAFGNFLDPSQAKDGSFDRLHEIRIPILIANGKNPCTMFGGVS